MTIPLISAHHWRGVTSIVSFQRPPDTAAAGPRLLVQTEARNLWGRPRPQEQAKESPDGMKLQPVKWALQPPCLPLEKLLLAHLL